MSSGSRSPRNGAARHLDCRTGNGRKGRFGSGFGLPGGTLKKAQALKATLVFVDESGFSLTPYRGRTWAPRGKTPILRHCCNWPKLSAISRVTPALEAYMQLVKGGIKTPEVIDFVRHLLNHIPGPICLFWDNNRPRKSKLTQETLAGFAPRLSVYRLPSYAPEPDPDERVWQHLKCDALRGFCPVDLKELINQIHRATGNLRRRPALVQSFFKDCPLFS